MTDMAHLQAVVRQNPKRDNEGAMQYIQRICVLAGLIRPEETAGPPPGGWVDAGTALEEPEEAWFQR